MTLRYVEITRLLQCIFLCNYVSPLHLTPSYSPLQSLFCLAQMNLRILSQIIVIKIKCLSLSYIIVFPKRLYNDLLLGRRLHDLSVQGIVPFRLVRSRTLKKACNNAQQYNIVFDREKS